MTRREVKDSTWNRYIEALSCATGTPDASNPLVNSDDDRLIEYTGTPTACDPLTAGSAGDQAQGKSFGNHKHWTPGGLVSLIAQKSITNDASQQTILDATIVDGTAMTGATIEFDADGLITTESGASLGCDFIISYGQTVLTGDLQLTLTPTCDVVTAVGWHLHATVQIRDIGTAATGAMIANGYLLGEFGANLAQCMVFSKNSTVVNGATYGRDNHAGISFKWGTASTGNILLVENAHIAIIAGHA